MHRSLECSLATKSLKVCELGKGIMELFRNCSCANASWLLSKLSIRCLGAECGNPCSPLIVLGLCSKEASNGCTRTRRLFNKTEISKKK